ncbi:hypothetical protein FAY30_20865 [Bacillus sp. S3]|uniref:hypothetical protein n=1 Tax=Bacillus sp. S3 TaxID=486398 RepID=UPI001188EEC6|nr:hypothetical protein [Bacillus sp. S3]QCJ44159.1 hypothetical protein FAY30_20865 [Bacillus sp. S3]
MNELLQTYASTFSSQVEKISLSEKEQRRINHPIVFLFLGDRVTDALQTMIAINQEKWQNSSGVVYLHTYQTDTIKNNNVLSFQLPKEEFDRKTRRRAMYEAFFRDESLLIELNKTFRTLAAKLAQYGKEYSSLKKVNLCVVTAIEDPATILIQEFTLLLKSILQESFLIVEVDLYGLLKEKQDGHHFAYSTALGISFLKELDGYQQGQYSFVKDLQLTEDHLRLPVKHPPSPLFDLVYLLSDKNEEGLISSTAMKQNMEIISNLNLLKNRKMISDYHEKMDSYHHQDFKRGIKGNSQEPVYASAGLAKVTRPNKAIALHTAQCVFTELVNSLRMRAAEKRETVLDLVELSQTHFQSYFRQFLPPAEKLEDMNALMGGSSSYQTIKNMTVSDAEAFLFEDGAQSFFYHNIELPTLEHLQVLDLSSHIERCLYENIIHHEQYGLFCAYLWTAGQPGSEINVLHEIDRLERAAKQDLLEKEALLTQFYQQPVEQLAYKKSYLPFSDKKNFNSFVRCFFETIYGAKYEILKLKVKKKILQQYRKVLQEHHHKLQTKIEIIGQVEAWLKQSAPGSLDHSDDYLDQNIAEYYAAVIRKITAKLKEKRGPFFFSDQRFFGSLPSLLESGNPETVMKRLLQVCHLEVLTQEEFHRSFEDELLERANVMTRYENREILSKEDLFKRLYLRLQDNTAIQIKVFNYTQEHRYEEKYFFGDFYSKFIRFALEKELETRQWKVGCVHERKSSGIEKLSLMGGFRLKDLMYVRNGEKYYDAYCSNDFEFHIDLVKTSV